MSLITVLLPVYNADKYLKKSISSILNQTYEDFELIIIDDCSNDKSVEIINGFMDKRINLYIKKKKTGLVDSLNWGLSLSQGQYIARMDADDISLPKRLEKQLKFMQENSDIISCGTQIQCFNEKYGNYSFFKLPTEPNNIFAWAVYKSALVHATSLTKREVFNKFNYDNNYLHTEDYHLWSRMLLNGKLANLNEVLYLVRIHQESVSQKYNNIQKNNAKKIFKFWLSKMNIQPTDEELELNRPIFERKMEVSVAYIKKVENWLSKLYIQNQKTKVFPEPNFTNLLRDTWVRHTLGFSYLGISLWKIWKKSPLSEGLLTDFQRFKFWLKCLLKY